MCLSSALTATLLGLRYKAKAFEARKLAFLFLVILQFLPGCARQPPAEIEEIIVSNTASIGAHRGVNIGGAFGAGNAVFRNGLVLASYDSGMVATDKADTTVTNSHIATNACMGDAWFAHSEGNYDALGDGTSDESEWWHTTSNDFTPWGSSNINTVTAPDLLWTPPAETIYVVGADDVYWGAGTVGFYNQLTDESRRLEIPLSIAHTGAAWEWMAPVHEPAGLRGVYQRGTELAIHT